MSRGLTVEWTGPQCRRRLRFEARDAGGWRRVEERYDGGEWTFVGSDIVAGLVVEDNCGAVRDVAAEAEAGP